MASIETIEHPDDPRLADYREIRDAARRLRDGTFIAEGREKGIPASKVAEVVEQALTATLNQGDPS